MDEILTQSQQATKEEFGQDKQDKAGFLGSFLRENPVLQRRGWRKNKPLIATNFH